MSKYFYSFFFKDFTYFKFLHVFTHTAGMYHFNGPVFFTIKMQIKMLKESLKLNSKIQSFMVS